jgi:hypothetical protein
MLNSRFSYKFALEIIYDLLIFRYSMSLLIWIFDLIGAKSKHIFWILWIYKSNNKEYLKIIFSIYLINEKENLSLLRINWWNNVKELLIFFQFILNIFKKRRQNLLFYVDNLCI